MIKKIRTSGDKTGIRDKVLIPVDFSSLDMVALKFGFALAKRLDRRVSILHAYNMPVLGLYEQFPDEFDGMDDLPEEIAEIQSSRFLEKESERKLEDLKSRIISLQEKGELPDVEFENILTAGLPEEAISEFCDNYAPIAVVMATRDRSKREEGLVGSVTIEVIDNAKHPVFSLPEDYKLIDFKQIVRLLSFCHQDETDMFCISELLKMFDNPSIDVLLYPISEKIFSRNNPKQYLENLKLSLQQEYPECNFDYYLPESKDPMDDIKKICSLRDIQMIIAPSKRKNIFARLFNPSVPHRLLFEINIPMIVIPT